MDMTNHQWTVNNMNGNEEIFNDIPPTVDDLKEEAGRIKSKYRKKIPYFVGVGFAFFYFGFGDFWNNRLDLGTTLNGVGIGLFIWYMTYVTRFKALGEHYRTDNKGVTSKFNEYASSFQYDENKKKVLDYISHPNFSSREATLGELNSLRKLYQMEEYERGKVQAKSNLKSGLNI